METLKLNKVKETTRTYKIVEKTYRITFLELIHQINKNFKEVDERYEGCSLDKNLNNVNNIMYINLFFKNENFEEKPYWTEISDLQGFDFKLLQQIFIPNNDKIIANFAKSVEDFDGNHFVKLELPAEIVFRVFYPDIDWGNSRYNICDKIPRIDNDAINLNNSEIVITETTISEITTEEVNE